MLLIVAALAVVRARNFTSGIVAAGMVGFTLALVFLFRGAPDLAFTQFSVEALAVVIFLAIVGRMPFREPEFRSRSDRLRDGAVAATLGIAATLVMLAVLAEPFDPRLSDFFRAASCPKRMAATSSTSSSSISAPSTRWVRSRFSASLPSRRRRSSQGCASGRRKPDELADSHDVEPARASGCAPLLDLHPAARAQTSPEAGSSGV